MHLMPPMYSTTGKKRAKQKFASAEQKRLHEQLTQEWDSLKTKHISTVTIKKSVMKKKYTLSIPEGRGTDHIPSRNTGIGTALKQDIKIYTGDKVKGIGTMHKSNAVPIFSDEEAIEISKMRRG